MKFTFAPLALAFAIVVSAAGVPKGSSPSSSSKSSSSSASTPASTACSGTAYGTGGTAPAGYNAAVENFCSAPSVLQCCTTLVAGAASLNDATAAGCSNAMAGGQVTYLFGYCPTGVPPLCCAVVAAGGTASLCGLPTQVQQPK